MLVSSFRRRDQTESLRTCQRCGEKKPISDFHKASRRADGLQTRCKPCNNHRTLEIVDGETRRKWAWEL